MHTTVWEFILRSAQTQGTCGDTHTHKLIYTLLCMDILTCTHTHIHPHTQAYSHKLTNTYTTLQAHTHTHQHTQNSETIVTFSTTFLNFS